MHWRKPTRQTGSERQLDFPRLANHDKIVILRDRSKTQQPAGKSNLAGKKSWL
jgi:hypothetical protein